VITAAKLALGKSIGRFGEELRNGGDDALPYWVWGRFVEGRGFSRAA